MAVLALFQFLIFFGHSNYIHKSWVYSCMFHFNWLSFVEFSFIYDACRIAPLFPRHFCVLLLELIISWFPFDINNYSVFTFTMVTIPFGLTADLTVFAKSSAMISYITSKSLINKICVCIFHATHFSSIRKFDLQN